MHRPLPPTSPSHPSLSCLPPVAFHSISYSGPHSVNKSANLPILLWTSMVAFNCLSPWIPGTARWVGNPKGKKPFEGIWNEWRSSQLKQCQALSSETNSQYPCCRIFVHLLFFVFNSLMIFFFFLSFPFSSPVPELGKVRHSCCFLESLIFLKLICIQSDPCDTVLPPPSSSPFPFHRNVVSSVA